MTDADIPTGSHQDQQRDGLRSMLARAGIGALYIDRKLDQLPDGPKIKQWALDHSTYFGEGWGVDIRGSGAGALDAINIFGRFLVLAEYGVRVMPLVRVAAALKDPEGRAELAATDCLLIRDFETARANPLREWETADVEAFLTDRITDLKSVSVWRHGDEPAGWWSGPFEAILQERRLRVLQVTR